jgi:hypothetical protein
MNLKGMVRKSVEADSFSSGQDPVVGCCGHSNELVGPIKCWEFLE